MGQQMLPVAGQRWMNENKDILHSRHVGRFFLPEGAMQCDDSSNKRQRHIVFREVQGMLPQKILKIRLSETYIR